MSEFRSGPQSEVFRRRLIGEIPQTHDDTQPFEQRNFPLEEGSASKTLVG